MTLTLHIILCTSKTYMISAETAEEAKEKAIRKSISVCGNTIEYFKDLSNNLRIFVDNNSNKNF